MLVEFACDKFGQTPDSYPRHRHPQPNRVVLGERLWCPSQTLDFIAVLLLVSRKLLRERKRPVDNRLSFDRDGGPCLFISAKVEVHLGIEGDTPQPRCRRPVVDHQVIPVSYVPDRRGLRLATRVHGSKKPNEIGVKDFTKFRVGRQHGHTVANTACAYRCRVVIRQISDLERRSRLAVRHKLAVSAESPVEAARGVFGLHSSDPATVFLAARARMPGMSVEDLESTLYDERALVRILGMRRTMWVVPTEVASVVNSSSTADLVVSQQIRTTEMLESSGIAKDGAAWIETISDRILEILGERGATAARDLSSEIPELKQKITYHRADGKVLGDVGVSTRILFLLATEGRIIRSRPLGSWISSQYRWTRLEDWLGSPLEAIPRQEAQTELLASWLRVFGPATELDMKWWTGWPVTQVRTALETLGAIEVGLEEDSGYVLADDVEPVPEPAPWVALLPSLDPTTMGWKQRDWYIGEHSSQLFDRFGNAGPTIWAGGRVIGGWAQRRDGEIVFEIFEDITSETEGMLDTAVHQLQRWMGQVVVTPRFRSPSDKRLTG